jgi:hypothetical protein
MTFDATTKSDHLARQLYLYKLELSGIFLYRWTNSPRTVTATVDGETLTFKRVRGGIFHSEPTESADAGKTGLELRVGPDNPVWRKHRLAPPAGNVTVTVYKQVESNGEAQLEWSGVVVETPYEQQGNKTYGVLRCEQEYALTQGAEGLIDSYGPSCLWRLGVLPCPVPVASVTDAAEVVSIDTDLLQVVVTLTTPRIAGWFELGQFVAPNGDRRTINVDELDGSDHVLTLLNNFPAGTLTAGDAVGLIWGDKLRYQDCRDKLGEWTGNGAAFGGNNLQGNVNFHQIGRLAF